MPCLRSNAIVGSLVTLLTISVIGYGQTPSGQRTGPSKVVRRNFQAIERMVVSRNDESLKKFQRQYLAKEYRDKIPEVQLHAYLSKIRNLYRDNGEIRIEPAGTNGFIIHFMECAGENTPLHVTLQESPPHQIVGLRLGKDAVNSSRKSSQYVPKRITWGKLEARLKEEETAGFSGAVLVVRNGNIILHQDYGKADRTRSIRNDATTLFAIGSIPMDFTKAAIFKLVDLGKVKTSDSIAKYLPNVPNDKKPITIDHLLQGKSGLRNFHERVGDANVDLSWIDRQEALSRILNDDLLFEPGTDHAHSHSGYGVLAAIVEYVSGESIEKFWSRYLFQPSGMNSTGLFQEAQPMAHEAAIGYGGQTFGEKNSPLYWGKTSWLVMGSGGMVSSPGDLHKFVLAMRDGKILTEKSQRNYWSPKGSVLAGGDSNGFEAAYTEGPGNMMFLCSNSIENIENTKQLIRDLARLMYD